MDESRGSRRPVAVAVAFSLLFGLASCGGNGDGNVNNRPAAVNSAGGAAPSDSSSPKVVFVLFDVSASASDAGTRERYEAAFRRVVDRIGAGDVLVADALGDNPLAQSSFPVNMEFPRFEPKTDNDLMIEKKRKIFDESIREQRQQAATLAGPLLTGAGEGTRKTAILDSMLLAQRVFATYDRPRKILVLFSDMIEDSDRANFSKTPPAADQAKRAVESDRAAGKMPKLDGVRIYVIGASSTSGQSGASDRFLAVQRFWLEYLKETGADAAAERYGAALLQFEE